MFAHQQPNKQRQGQGLFTGTRLLPLLVLVVALWLAVANIALAKPRPDEPEDEGLAGGQLPAVTKLTDSFDDGNATMTGNDFVGNLAHHKQEELEHIQSQPTEQPTLTLAKGNGRPGFGRPTEEDRDGRCGPKKHACGHGNCCANG